jgi:alpha 1,6-mannosyltransferase
MLTFKRAIITAAFFLTVLYFISISHSATPETATPIPKQMSDKAQEDGASDATGSSNVPSSAGEASPDKDAQQQRISEGPRPPTDMSKMSLYQKLEYQFPYDLPTRFPAYIWQTWKTTPADPDFKFRDHEASWSDQHPGFVHEVITDEVAPKLLRVLYGAVPEVLEAYEALPKPVLKADYFRYLILLARGGIYSDIDTVALRSAIEWVPDKISRSTLGLIIGIEADPDRPDWHDWYSRRIQFCQWTIQAKPGHPVLRDIVARITQDTLRRKRAGLLANFPHEKVIEFTGPAVWTDVIFDYLNDGPYFDMARSPGPVDHRTFTGMEEPRKVGDVLVLPITSFSPGVGQMGAKDYDDPMAFVKHDFEGSWKPDELRHIGETVEAEK